jgi:hypothetical protein
MFELSYILTASHDLVSIQKTLFFSKMKHLGYLSRNISFGYFHVSECSPFRADRFSQSVILYRSLPLVWFCMLFPSLGFCEHLLVEHLMSLTLLAWFAFAFRRGGTWQSCIVCPVQLLLLMWCHTGEYHPHT